MPSRSNLTPAGSSPMTTLSRASMNMEIGSNPYCFADVMYEAITEYGPACPRAQLPIVNYLHQANVSPIVVVVPDSGRLELLARYRVLHLRRSLGHRGKPGELERAVRAEQQVPPRRTPRGYLADQRDIDRNLLGAATMRGDSGFCGSAMALFMNAMT